MTDERNTLKCIFGRSFDDLQLRNKLSQLCATYLGGIWTTVPSEQIRIATQRGGSNNKILMVELPDEMKFEYNKSMHKVILRIYENLNENNELPEGIITAVLSERRLSPRLLGIFPGGRFEEYIPSRPLTNDEYCKACVAQEVGRILARIHSLDMPISKECRLAQFVDDMIERLRSSDRWKTQNYPMHTTLAKVDKAFYPDLITIDLLAEELEICKKCLAQSGSPLVFSNNDLHEGNLLLRDGIKITDQGLIGRKDDEDPIILIDYEYGCYYYRGFDLCHYCVECCLHNEGNIWPYYEVKQNQWPNEAIQRLYISAYIDEAMKICVDNNGKRIQCIRDLSIDREISINHLLNEIRQFAAFPHLFWAIWSFEHAEITQTNFDHFEYAFDRLALYYYWKSEMLKYLN
ncbi:Choline/ethanolamine kinase family protein [Brugia pahangi]